MLREAPLRLVLAAVVLAFGCNSSTTPTAPSQSGSGTAGVLTELVLSTASVDGGQAVTGTVTITQPVPAAPVAITVAIAGPGASAPASVIVPAGQAAATFTITTTSVDADTDVTVTARHGNVERTRALRLRGARTQGGPLAELDPSPDEVVGGHNADLTVRLAEPAPAAGIVVRLASDTPKVSVPSSVAVPAGATSASVRLRTFPVTAETEARVTASVDAATRALKGAAAATPAAELTIVFRLLPPSDDDSGELVDDEGTPTLASLTPARGAQGETVAVTLTGANFVNGASVGVSGIGVTVSDVVIVDAGTITARFAVAPDAPVGPRSVAVTTAEGTSSALTFTVDRTEPTDPGEPPVPTLTAVSPASAVQGTTVAVTLTGANFVNGASIGVSGTGITVSDVVVVDETTMTADCIVAPDAATGARSVTITTSAGTSGAQAFMVAPAEPSAPTLTAIAPGSGVQGATVAVTLTGANFVDGASIGVSGTGITVSDVVVVDETTMTADFVVAPDAPTGARSVTVTTSAGTSGAQTFTVELAAPTLSGISPSSAAQGETVVVTLTGTSFVDGASIDVTGTGVSVGATDVIDATTITAEFTVSGIASLGTRSVTVTTSAGTTDAQLFTVVLPPPPTLDAVPVMPATSLAGPTIGVVITGTNFVAGATDVVVSGGISVGNIVVTSPTSITADFGNLTNSSETTFTITVTTSGGSATETVTSGAVYTGDRSFEGFENSRCIPVTLRYEDTPGSESEMFVSTLPARGRLYHYDASQPNGVGAEVGTDDVFSSVGSLCFVPEPHDHSIPIDATYASLLAVTRSRTVVGTIERSALIEIVVAPMSFPPIP